MTEYYDDQAKLEAFDERWAPREELNEALDRIEELEALNEKVAPRLQEIDRLIEGMEALEALVEGGLFNLRKAADDLLRASDLTLETIETNTRD